MAGKGKVLVTGASGYLGMSIVELLLQKGYTIRVSVRNQKRADQLLSKFPQYKDKIDIVFADISQPGAFDTLLQGIEGVIHVASPLPGHAKGSIKADILDPAVQGAVSVLEAAIKVPTIKRIVMTSSIAAVLGASSDPTHVVSEKDWNPTTVEQAEQDKNPFTAYVASKKLSERAAWDFVEKNKPKFDLVTILPPFFFGPTSQTIESASDLSSTYGMLYDHINGKVTVPQDGSPFDYLIDIRDVALAHILAYETPKAANQRYLISGHPFEWQEIPAFANKHFPGLTKATTQPAAAPLTFRLSLDTSKATNELKITYHKKEDTLRENIAQIIEFNKQGILPL